MAKPIAITEEEREPIIARNRARIMVLNAADILFNTATGDPTLNMDRLMQEFRGTVELAVREYIAQKPRT